MKNSLMLTLVAGTLAFFLVASTEVLGEASHSGRTLPFLMAADFQELDLVAWRVEEGVPDKDNPLMEPAMPWDAGGVFSHGTVLIDPIDQRWKAWHISTPVSQRREFTWRQRRMLTYLESEDGVHWQRPELSLVPYEKHEKTNILMEPWCSYASVLIHPDREMPYEMFLFHGGLRRYRSKDGQRWEDDGKVDLTTADSCYIYRIGEQYVSYHKKADWKVFPGGLTPYDIADGRMRVIGRRTSRDGKRWTDPTRIVLLPDWRDPADTQFMELCPIQVPGGFIAYVTVYHTRTQTIDLQWAASRNGVDWWRPERRPALSNPPLGDYGGGMIWPMRKPVIHDDKLHVYYAGCEALHGDLYNTEHAGRRPLKARGERVSRQPSSLPNYSALCRASWQADRLWALASAVGGPYVGTATTKRLSLSDCEVLVNLRTRRDGELRVEMLDKSGAAIPGYTREDCVPLRGDHHAASVRWKGGAVAPENAVQLRFYLKRAFLYGFVAE